MHLGLVINNIKRNKYIYKKTKIKIKKNLQLKKSLLNKY